MDDPGRDLAGQAGAQEGLDLVGAGVVKAGGADGGGPGPTPGVDLALHIALGLAQVAQAHGGGVEGVELGQGVDEGEGEVAALRLRRPVLDVLHRVEGMPVQEVHDVEMGPGDRRVLAVGEGAGRRDGSILKGREDPELPAHVVGLGQEFTEGRAADYGLPAPGVGQPPGQVGVAAGQAHPVEGAGQLRTVRRQPGLDDGAIISGNGVCRSGGFGHGLRPRWRKPRQWRRDGRSQRSGACSHRAVGGRRRGAPWRCG